MNETGLVKAVNVCTIKVKSEKKLDSVAPMVIGSFSSPTEL